MTVQTVGDLVERAEGAIEAYEKDRCEDRLRECWRATVRAALAGGTEAVRSQEAFWDLCLKLARSLRPVGFDLDDEDANDYFLLAAQDIRDHLECPEEAERVVLDEGPSGLMDNGHFLSVDLVEGEVIVSAEPVFPAWGQPVKREKKKVGRNAPCPCGSGRKYKKCCL